MLKYLENKRIYHHFTFPGNPQQNGKIESFWKKIDKNRSFVKQLKIFLLILLNTIKCVLILDLKKHQLEIIRDQIMFFMMKHWDAKDDILGNILLMGRLQNFHIKKIKKLNIIIKQVFFYFLLILNVI